MGGGSSSEEKKPQGGGNSNNNNSNNNLSSAGTNAWLASAALGGGGASRGNQSGGGLVTGATLKGKAGQNRKRRGSAAPASGEDDPASPSANLVNPLVNASVIDSSRNKFVPFVSTNGDGTRSSRASVISAAFSASASSSRGSTPSGGSPRELSFGSAASAGQNVSNSGSAASSSPSSSPTLSPVNTSSSPLGGLSTLNLASGDGGQLRSPKSFQLSQTRPIQSLPSFGFINNFDCNVSGWSDLQDCSLEEEAGFVLSETGRAAPPNTSFASGGGSSFASNASSLISGSFASSSSRSPGQQHLSLGRKRRNVAPPSHVLHQFAGSTTDAVKVPVLSTPAQQVMSALQPLATAKIVTNPNLNRRSSTSSKNKRTSVSSAPIAQSSSTSEITELSIEARQKMEAASRCRYAIPVNYSLEPVGFEPHPIRSVCSTGDGSQYVVVCCESSSAKLVDPERRSVPSVATSSSGSSLLEFKSVNMEEIIACSVCRDGRYVVTSARDISATSWDLSNGKKVRDLGLNATVRALVVSDDGEVVVGTSGEDAVCVWETKSGDVLSNCSIHSGVPTAVAITRRGNIAASGTASGEVCVWQCPSGAVTFRFSVNRRTIRSLSFSFDGNRLLAVDEESARIWDTFTGELVCTRFRDDSIALGDEDRVSVSNGSMSASFAARRGSNSGGGSGGGGGGGSANQQPKRLRGYSTYVPLTRFSPKNQQEEDEGNSNNNNHNHSEMRKPPPDPMDAIYSSSTTHLALTCGVFAGCNVAVIGSNTGMVLVVEPNTATELLSLTLRRAVRTMSPAWQGDVVYLGDHGGNVYKLSLDFPARAIQDFNVTQTKSKRNVDMS